MITPQNELVWNTGTVTIATYPDSNGTDVCLSNLRAYNQGVTVSGEKLVVVCNGQSHEVKDLVAAQSLAETLAHQHNTDAYILKPIKKVAPKRDVVTTDLE